MQSKRFVQSAFSRTLLLPASLSAAAVLSVIGLYQIAPQSLSFSPAVWVAFAILAALFTLADLLAGDLNTGLWAGYLNFAVMTAWVGLGIQPALCVLLLGVMGSALVRALKRPQFHPVHPALHPLRLPLERIAIQGAALAVAHLCFLVLRGTSDIELDAPETIGPLAVALVVSVLVTQVIGLLLVPPALRNGVLARLFWAVGQRVRIVQELLLIVLVPTTIIILDNAGVVVFALLMGVIASQAVRYRHIKHTEQSLIRRIHQLAVIDTVGRDIAANLALDDLLIGIHAQINRLLPVIQYSVALVDHSRESVRFPLMIIHGRQQQVNEESLQELPLLRAIIEEKRPLNRNFSLEPLPTSAVNWQPGWFLGFPLIEGEQVLGALCVVVEPDALVTADEMATIEQIARQAGMTIRNAVLYSRTQAIADNLQHINDFARNVVLHINVSESLFHACETARTLTHADSAAVILLDNELDFGDRVTNEKRVASTANFPDPLISPLRQWYESFDRQHEVVAIHNVTDQTKVQLEFLQSYAASVLVVPLQSGGTTQGGLFVFHAKPHRYQQDEIDTVNSLAHHVTAALDNAVLLQALESYAAEQSQLVHLSRISTSTLDMTQVIDRVTSLLREMLATKCTYVALYNEDHSELRLFTEKAIEPVSANSLPDLAMLNRTPLILEDSQGLAILRSRMQGFSPEMQGFSPESIVAAPLWADEVQLGVILAGYAQTVNTNEIRVLELAANQIAAQLHNAIRYHEVQTALQRRLGQMEIIEEVARQISGTLHMEQVIENVLEAVAQATNADRLALGLLRNDGRMDVTSRLVKGDGEWHSEYFELSDQTPSPMLRAAAAQQIIYANGDTEPTQDGTTATYQSALYLPLIKDRRSIGVLEVQSKQANALRDDQVSFISSLAGHAVMSIENARLMHERQVQITALTKLRELSLVTSTETDFSAVVRAILEAALVLLNSDLAIMYDISDTFPVPHYLDGLARTVDGRFQQAKPNRLFEFIESIMQYDEIQYVDLSSDQYSGTTHSYTGLFIVPIKHSGRIREVLVAACNHPPGDLVADMNTLELLAIQAAGHLENTLLYEYVQSGNNRISAILDSSSDGIILLDRHGRLMQANLSAETLLGIPLDDVVGQSFADMLLKRVADRSAEFEEGGSEGLLKMARILRLEPERITRHQYEIRRHHQIVYIEEVGSPVIDSRNEIVGRLLVLRDISEQKMLEKYRDEITNMAVHDLRGPLASIIASLELSMDIVADPQDTPLEFTLVPSMEVSLDSARSLLRLVDSLLDIAKLEDRSMPLQLSCEHIGEIIDTAAAALRGSLDEAGLILVKQIPDELPPVNVDHDKLIRVCFNLLDNAVRYSPAGGQIMVDAQLMENGEKVLVRISDSGRGIPPEERDRVFEKFRQIKTSTPNRGRKGSGLGLTFCKLTVMAHGGDIWVAENGPLTGATFAFMLPVYLESNGEDT